jgi:thiamine pyrophosphate-dependent acetolactate synthase large subunit-like protein
MSEHATCLVKGSDYIVSFLIDNGVTDVFGIPGGVICIRQEEPRHYCAFKLS